MDKADARHVAYNSVSAGDEMMELGWERKNVWRREHEVEGGETSVANVWMIELVQFTEVIAGSQSAETPSCRSARELRELSLRSSGRNVSSSSPRRDRGPSSNIHA